jgi:deoxyribose-phosphate aldolase
MAEVGADFVRTSVGLLRGSKPATAQRVKLMYDTASPKGIELLTGIKNSKEEIDY